MNEGEEFLAKLQAKSKAGFHKTVGWVDDQSSVAKALRLMDDELLMETGRFYFWHPVFGPWRIAATEEAVAALAQEKGLEVLVFIAHYGIGLGESTQQDSVHTCG